MMFGAISILIVAPGTIWRHPITGIETVVDDTTAALDHHKGEARMTQPFLDRLVRLIEKQEAA